jgi:hypothetical protein
VLAGDGLEVDVPLAVVVDRAGVEDVVAQVLEVAIAANVEARRCCGRQ